MLKLKIYLLTHKISRKEFAEKCDISSGYLTSVLNNLTKPSKKLIRKILQNTNGELTENDLISKPVVTESYDVCNTCLHDTKDLLSSEQ